MFPTVFHVKDGILSVTLQVMYVKVPIMLYTY
jgi:hypothetical protein